MTTVIKSADIGPARVELTTDGLYYSVVSTLYGKPDRKLIYSRDEEKNARACFNRWVRLAKGDTPKRTAKKRVTVWAILAENEAGEKVVFYKGSREEVRAAWEKITQGKTGAPRVSVGGEVFTVYAIGSKRTTTPDNDKAITDNATLYAGLTR